MAGAEHFAPDIKHLAEAWVQTRGHDRNSGCYLFTGGKRDKRSHGTAADPRDFGCDMPDVGWNLLSDRIPQVMIENSGAAAWLAVDQPAIAHDPDFTVNTGMRQHIVGKVRKTEQREL